MDEVLKAITIVPKIIYLCLEALVLSLIPNKYRYKEVEGEVVLITGGGSGIGRLLALRFARLGCQVVIWDVNEKGNRETEELVKNDGGECYSYVCDITDRKKVYDLALKVRDEVGPVTILINNAGIVTGNLLMDSPDTLIEKTFQVNAISHFWMCKAFLPDMIAANHGHIVTVASIAGMCGCAKMVDYCSSKFAAVGFHESLMLELRKQNLSGIKTTLVCPYFIDTGMFAGVNTGHTDFLQPDYVADEIVSAVRTDRALLVLPTIYSCLLALKSFYPISVGLLIHDFLKADSFMDHFVGRRKNPQ